MIQRWVTSALVKAELLFRRVLVGALDALASSATPASAVADVA